MGTHPIFESDFDCLTEMPVLVSGTEYLSEKTEVREIVLIRGEDGLGFNIRGGFDAPYIKEDPGIFVTKIRDSGAAITSGLIKVGDKVVEINGIDLTKSTHSEAVQAFVSAGNEVTLKIISNHYNNIIETRQRRSQEREARKRYWRYTFGAVSIALISYFVYKRMSKSELPREIPIPEKPIPIPKNLDQ